MLEVSSPGTACIVLISKLDHFLFLINLDAQHGLNSTILQYFAVLNLEWGGPGPVVSDFSGLSSEARKVTIHNDAN